MAAKAYSNKKAVLSQRWPRDARCISRLWAVAEIWPFEIIQDGGGRHLEIVRIENSAIRSAVPENPTLEQNMKWIESPVAEIWPFAYLGGIWNPHFGGRGCRRGSARAPLERAMVVSYRISIVTIALYRRCPCKSSYVQITQFYRRQKKLHNFVSF